MSLYLYALAEGAAPAAPGDGAWGEPLRALEAGGILSLVGELEAAPALGADALRGHDQVARRLSSQFEALLPARFGTCLRDERELAELLERRRAPLLEALERVRGREQMTVRLFRAEGAPDPGARPLPADAGPGTRYLLAAQAAAHPQLPELDSLRAALGALVLAERREPHATRPLVASAYHLVRRGTHDEYREALERVAGQLAPSRIAASGPFPAYAFAPEELP